MMLNFQWDALRRGDRVFVHDARDADIGVAFTPHSPFTPRSPLPSTSPSHSPRPPASALGAQSRSLMAVAALSTPASMTAEQYHRITEHLDASPTGAPPGRRFHACFGHGDHLMVFDVWDSPEELDAFTATLMPLLAIEHIDMAPPEPLEIHDLIDGGDSRALRKTIAELRDKAFFIRPVEKLREKIHSVTGKPSENQGTDETPTSAR